MWDPTEAFGHHCVDSVLSEAMGRAGAPRAAWAVQAAAGASRPLRWLENEIKMKRSRVLLSLIALCACGDSTHDVGGQSAAIGSKAGGDPGSTQAPAGQGGSQGGSTEGDTGATSPDDISRIRQLERLHGGQWPFVWLDEKGVTYEALQ